MFKFKVSGIEFDVISESDAEVTIRRKYERVLHVHMPADLEAVSNWRRTPSKPSTQPEQNWWEYTG